jgi:hypothetical protein
MADSAKPTLHKEVHYGQGSEMEFWITVEDGKVFYTTQNDGHAFLRRGAEESRQEITLNDLKSHRVRGGGCYEEAVAEVARQKALLSETEG